MDTAALERTLSSGRPAPAYVIHGPEGFLRAHALRLIRDVMAGEDADVVELDAAGLDPRGLLDDLRTPGLFSPRRLLIVDHAEALIMESSDLLVAYAQKPSSASVLVLLAESLDGRRKAVKAVLAAASAVECPTVRPRDVPAWCLARARAHGKRMEAAAARMLLDLAGTNLGHLDGQIEGLATYCSDRPCITAQDVSDLVGGDHARNVWEIVRAAVSQVPAEALRALDRLRREPRFHAPMVLNSLARELRDLCRVHRALSRGSTPAEIQRALGKPDWLVRRFIKTVQALSPERLQTHYRMVLDSDVAAKTGRGPDWWILESLILRLCRPSS